MTYIPTYDKSRFPVQPRRDDGSLGCRGCGGEIPKGKNRSAWCSRKCKAIWHPTLVKFAVKRRDGGICQICRVDILAPLVEWKKLRAAWQRGLIKDLPFAPSCKIEYDHIIPMCEGGLTVAENMRATCVPCHRSVTKELAGKRAAERRSAKLTPPS